MGDLRRRCFYVSQERDYCNLLPHILDKCRENSDINTKKKE